MLNLSSLKAKLSLANWQYHTYKLGMFIVLIAGWSYFMWDKGRDYCEDAYSKGVAEQVVAEVNQRIPVVQQAEREAAELRTQLRTIKEKLDEEANKPSAANCGTTDVELQLYREAAAKTRR